ncbi:MAG: YdcF family protein, partial [Cyanobacteria bacterium]|nr:YdcF family protein [Cyanobacteriota bacterium]
MGFLLSKLLPLLLYPLGLGLLLQLLGLATAPKCRGRRLQSSLWLSSSGISLIWLFAMPVVSRQLIWGLEEQAAALTPQTIPRADAVVVLGGGLEPALLPRRAIEVKGSGDRLLTGVRLIRSKKTGLMITSGARSNQNFTSKDPAPPEAMLARDLAIELGVHADQILLNPSSRTTAEEAH